MRWLMFSVAILGFANSSGAGELDKESPTPALRVTKDVPPAAAATEMDRESPQQAWHRWGIWGAYRPWGFGYSAGFYFPGRFYAPAFYPPFVNIGWNGFYNWYGFQPYTPIWFW